MPENQEPEDTVAETGEAAGEQASEHHPPLSLWLRILLIAVGWLLVLIGIAGLVLPGIQGIATILIGAAVLSLVSEIVHQLLERMFRRWPKAWEKFQSFRSRLHDRIHRH